MQDSGHTAQWPGEPVERVLSNGKRLYATAFKAWIVEQAARPGVSVASLAMRHGVNANLLRRWMQMAQPRASLPQLLPITVTSSLVAQADAASACEPGPVCDAVIEIELHGALVRLRGDVDAGHLRTVLLALSALRA